MAYGDLTVGGVGTATAVCESEVLGFGHPAFWTGRSTATMHDANAIYVQEDVTFTPYKVANITDPEGRLTDDRFAAVNGEFGALPPTANVRSAASAEDRSRTGMTKMTVPDELPSLASYADLANLDRVFDGLSDGTARVRWIVMGTGPGGASFTLDRVDRVASPWDITFDAAFLPYEQLAAMQFYPGGVPQISTVDVRSAVDDQLRLFRIATVDVWKNGRWVRVPRDGSFATPGGERLRLRMNLTSYSGLAGKTRVEFRMWIPQTLAGRTLFVSLRGGNDAESFAPETETFRGLLRRLDSEVRNDEVIGTLSRFEGSRPIIETRQLVGEVLGDQWGANVRITQ
jgi:hypothetical protein